MKLIEALEGLEMKAGPDFPQGDKTMRKADHQAFLNEFIFEVHGGTYKLLETVPKRQQLGAAGLHVPCGVSTRGTGGSTRAPRRTSRGAASSAILRTEQLSVQFGGLAALSRVNFAVERGKTHAIIGPNGAGKSTFFNCLTGVLTPTSGRICLQRRGHHRPALRRDLAEGHRALLPDHQHPAQRHGVGERAHRRAIAPPRLEHDRPPFGLRRHQREGGSRAQFGRPARQGRRACLQSLARRATQSGNRHRARHRAATCCASTSRPPA